jgi:hypothetical protein
MADPCHYEAQQEIYVIVRVLRDLILQYGKPARCCQQSRESNKGAESPEMTPDEFLGSCIQAHVQDEQIQAAACKDHVKHYDNTELPRPPARLFDVAAPMEFGDLSEKNI